MRADELLASEICTAMMRVGTRMATVFDQHFAALGITQAQFRTLLVIRDAGKEGIAPSTLAELLLLERATVTVLASRLVEEGLVERRPGENRRTFRLALTPAGKQCLQRVVPHAVALADATLAGHSLEELRMIRQSLELIEARVRSYAQWKPEAPSSER